MLDIVASNRFKRDLKLAMRRGYDIGLLETVVDQLAAERPLDEKNTGTTY